MWNYESGTHFAVLLEGIGLGVLALDLRSINPRRYMFWDLLAPPPPPLTATYDRQLFSVGKIFPTPRGPTIFHVWV